MRHGAALEAPVYRGGHTAAPNTPLNIPVNISEKSGEKISQDPGAASLRGHCKRGGGVRGHGRTVLCWRLAQQGSLAPVHRMNVA